MNNSMLLFLAIVTVFCVPYIITRCLDNFQTKKKLKEMEGVKEEDLLMFYKGGIGLVKRIDRSYVRYVTSSGDDLLMLKEELARIILRIVMIEDADYGKVMEEYQKAKEDPFKGLVIHA